MRPGAHQLSRQLLPHRLFRTSNNRTTDAGSMTGHLRVHFPHYLDGSTATSLDNLEQLLPALGLELSFGKL